MPIAPSVARDILLAVRSQHWLSKYQVVRAWRLSGDEYSSLEKELAREADIIVDSSHSGFRVRAGKAELDGPSEERTVFVAPRGANAPPASSGRTENAGDIAESGLRKNAPVWQQAAATRLAELLTAATLSDLVGPLEKVVRNMRRLQTGDGRQNTKAELAYALLIVHAEDLFAEPPIRKAVAKALKVDYPKRWHPGKAAAIDFVRAANFPTELAGTPGEAKPDSFEYLEPPPQLKPLETYQLEVRDAMINVLSSSGGRAVLTLPTGAGKTRVAVDAVREVLFKESAFDAAQVKSVVWLAHTEELCEQACQSFIDVWRSSAASPPLHLVRFWGDHAKGEENGRALRDRLANGHTILVSSPRRFLSALTGRETTVPAEELLAGTSAIVIDEAHRAAAPTYRSIFEAAHKVSESIGLIGLTATPFRMEYDQVDPEKGTRELRELFKRRIEPKQTLGSNPRAKLQEQRVLARPEWTVVETHRSVSLKGMKWAEPPTEEQTEVLDKFLATEADDPNRRRIVLTSLLKLVRTRPDASVLYFGPSVADAHAIAYCLREAGCSAAVVSGETRDATRRRIIGDFRSGRVRVLTNCQVLTIGFDAPVSATCSSPGPPSAKCCTSRWWGEG